MSDASGAAVQDTKFERIAEHTKFIDSVIPKLPGSETLKALLESYNAAVSHPASELVRLFEIREKLSEHHGGDDEMRRRLGISEKHWKRFGSLTNDLPLKEGRHCGKHSNLRHATAVELDDARRIARGWIKDVRGSTLAAASSSTNAVSFSSARTTKRFPSPRCVSAIQIVCPLESIAKTQP